MSDNQHTIADRRRYSGIALHTGVRAHLAIRPAPANSGIRIVRIDLPDAPEGPAIATNVIDVRRATTLKIGNSAVHTVEHVLAALYATGIDNAVIEMDGPEPPIADGSSAPYLDLIEDAGGAVDLGVPRKYWKIKEPLWVEQGDSKVIILPDEQYRISCTVKFGTSIMGTQYFSTPITEKTFREEMSVARTFCLYHEIEALMVAGLIKGGSLDNAVVAKGDAIISKEGLRYPDEFVRHKMLDIVGDLSLAGRRIIGHVVAVKPGHPINVAMAQRIIACCGAAEEGN